MITANSRYSDSTLVTVKKASTNLTGNSNVLTITPSHQAAYTFNYIFYTVTVKDRVDSIANAFYGDVNAWYHIGDANPEILDWSNLKPGTVIRIPSAT